MPYVFQIYTIQFSNLPNWYKKPYNIFKSPRIQTEWGLIKATLSLTYFIAWTDNVHKKEDIKNYRTDYLNESFLFAINPHDKITAFRPSIRDITRMKTVSRFQNRIIKHIHRNSKSNSVLLFRQFGKTSQRYIYWFFNNQLVVTRPILTETDA